MAEQAEAAPKRSKAKAEVTAPTEPTTYHVFRASAPGFVDGTALTYLGSYAAENRTAARWAAVDANPALKDEVRTREGEEPRVHLVAVSSRMAEVEVTSEKVVETLKRT